MATISSTQDQIYLWWQIGYLGAVLSPICYFRFIYAFVNLKKRWLLYLIYILGIIYVIAILFFRDKFFGNLVFRYDQFWWFYWPKNKSILYLLFYISFWWILVGYSFFLTIRSYRESVGLQRIQTKYFILGSIFGWVGAEGLFLPKFIWNAYPYTNFLIAIYPVIFVYAMLRYRLMDIKVAITRTGIFVFVYSLVLGIPFIMAYGLRDWLKGILGVNWWIAPLGLMVALATVGPFVYIFLEKRAETVLLREQRRYQETLKQAAVGMTRIRDLKKLLDLVVHIVTKAVRISHSSLYLYDEKSENYLLHASRNLKNPQATSISKKSSLIAWLEDQKEPLVYEEIKQRVQDYHSELVFKEIEDQMRLLNASVLVPSFLEDSLMGFLVLGDKRSGQIYTTDDLNIFSVLASQAALAIENAQFILEAKEMQEQIAQAEKMVTIGTMADGLSHQINNRFNALSLIAGDTLDTVNLTDTSQCSPKVKEMVEQIKHALQRIEANVIQGGEVVRGLLKYSRPGDTGLEPLDLNTILNNTLEMVQYKIKLSEIDIIRDFPQDLPKIKGNMAQLEEVFFNFIDNAYDAIVERRSLLKENGYRGRITILAKPKRDQALEIEIEDNGIGIKNNDNTKVFTPFFTTKTSSRKGTGLGLYVIRKIITDTHKGKIEFESDYKVGTRFIMELPIAK